MLSDLSRGRFAQPVRKKWIVALFVLLIAGVAAGVGTILSNVLEYPGVVNDQMIITLDRFPVNGTAVTWYTGVSKNVSLMVQPRGYTGNAHPVYEVDAIGITCNDLQMMPRPDYGNSATCSGGSDRVSISADSKYFNGADNMFWWFDLVFYSGFPSITLRVYMVAG